MLKRRVTWVYKQDLRRCRRATWSVYKMARKCRYQTREFVSCAEDVSNNEVMVAVVGRNERCQTFKTTPSLRCNRQLPTSLSGRRSHESPRLADFILSRRCGIDEKTRTSGPYDRQNATFKFDIPTTSWHLSIRNGVQTFQRFYCDEQFFPRNPWKCYHASSPYTW